MKNTGLSGEAFAERLLKEQKVAVVPGNAFGQFGENNVRISYATSMNALSEAFDRMATFLTFYPLSDGLSMQYRRITML